MWILVIAYLLVSWYLVLIGIGLLGWREAYVFFTQAEFEIIDKCFGSLWIFISQEETLCNQNTLSAPCS